MLILELYRQHLHYQNFFFLALPFVFGLDLLLNFTKILIHCFDTIKLQLY